MNPSEPCPDNQPFTKCWCETRPNNPHCKSVPLDNTLFVILLLIGAIYLKLKRI